MVRRGRRTGEENGRGGEKERREEGRREGEDQRGERRRRERRRTYEIHQTKDLLVTQSNSHQVTSIIIPHDVTHAMGFETVVKP